MGEVTSLIGSLCSTAQAVLPAFLQMKYIQQQHISGMKRSQNPQILFCVNEDSIKELDWWVRNLELSNGRAMITSGIRVVIQTDASNEGLGRILSRQIDRETMDITGERSTHKCVKSNKTAIKAIKLTLLTFVKIFQMDKAHFQIDNMTALSYLVKMGGTRNREMETLAKEIWDFAQSRKLTITGEYLPERLNTEADWVSRHFQDSSKQLLSPRLFPLICKKQETPSVDLFVSRACHQLLLYIALKADPLSQGIDAFQQNWKVKGLTYAFPLFH